MMISSIGLNKDMTLLTFFDCQFIFCNFSIGDSQLQEGKLFKFIFSKAKYFQILLIEETLSLLLSKISCKAPNKIISGRVLYGAGRIKGTGPG